MENKFVHKVKTLQRNCRSAPYKYFHSEYSGLNLIWSRNFQSDPSFVVCHYQSFGFDRILMSNQIKSNLYIIKSNQIKSFENDLSNPQAGLGLITVEWLWLWLHSWLWLYDYDYVIMITWLWLRDYEYAITISFPYDVFTVFIQYQIIWIKLNIFMVDNYRNYK